jgi:hypothetical protein
MNPRKILNSITNLFGRKTQNSIPVAVLPKRVPSLSAPLALRIDPNIVPKVVKITCLQKPEYYPGPMPFSYNDIRMDDAITPEISLMHEFDGWKNLFIYDDPEMQRSGIAEGALAIDTNGKLLAVAKLYQIIKNNGFCVEEFHLNVDGDVVFYCKSFYASLILGEKTSEIDAVGAKVVDCFFLWPTR